MLLLGFGCTLGLAQNPLEGTWTVDMSSVQFPAKPDVLVVQNGTYQCKSCVPPINLKADGSDQKVTGHPYFDTMSIKVVDDHNIEGTTKRNGQVVGTEKDSVSADGNTLTTNWTDSGQPSGGTQSGTSTATRVGKAPASGNMVTGSWRTQKADSPAAVLTWTYKFDGDELTMTNPTGQSYTAKLDGTDAPYKGDPGTTSVSVKMLDKDTLVETDKRNGKTIGVLKMTAAADGKMAKASYEDKLRGTTVTGQAQKQ
jgi:hypothetical protein